MITSLVLAAKFFCETQEVVVNADIARLLSGSKSAAAFDLNAMEAAFADLIDFHLFVSQEEYNKEANKVNLLLQKARQEELAQRQKSKLQRKQEKKEHHKNSHIMQRMGTIIVPKSQSLQFFCKVEKI